MEVITVETTVVDDNTARSMARSLVERRLAACVQMTPVRSVYRWEGQVRTDEEILLRCKSTVERRAALEAAIREIHPYELPEILCAAVDAADDYAVWVHDETTGTQ